MSGHTSRSRSPSTGPNGRQHSPSFGQGQNHAMDPSLFNSSVYQAGANYQNQSPNQFLNASQMNGGFDMTGQNFNEFAFEGKNGMMNGGGLVVDPALENGNGVNPTDIMGNMSPQDTMSPTSGLGSGVGSQHHSPALQQAGFANASPAHSRHHSLDPASAGIGQGHVSEWMGHRRSPSDQSDVSSAAHSPFQPGADFSDGLDVAQNHSPMLNPSNDPSLFQEDMSRFTISDARHRASLSQQNSPYISPSLVPAPANSGLPDGQFVLPSNVQQDAFIANDIGQADTMMAPSINVELAPSGPAGVQAGADGSIEALSPPQRGRMGRNRAKSDTSLGPGPISRPLSPNELTPNFAPQPGMLNADINQPQRHRSLSPFDATFPANYRSSSPGSARSSRRSSTSSINPNRDYILELADPNRPSANPSGTRVQKHPATFQCTMCPKRFTRAYNLRSHLRTHTDERPFVCSVCGKAFARQHDRKRHEGLHSGEKKFVCKGDLANGQGQWGCGRRFARADALGRHFRSEAGRVCIKPLLDEEMAEKRRAYEQSVIAGAGMGPHNMGQMPPGGMPPPPGVLPSQGPGVDLGMSQGGVGPVPGTTGFALPQAILAQYPALQGLQWDQIGSGPVGGDDDGALSGRSSFDASGEVYDDEEGYLSGSGANYAQSGWASDQGGL